METFRLPDEILQSIQGSLDTAEGALTEAADELNDFVTDAREEWDERDEKWQNSAEGERVGTWLDTLEDQATDLADISGNFAAVEQTPPTP